MRSKVRIEYRIGNRRVSEHELQRHLERQAVDSLASSAMNVARRVRCPVHGSLPTSVYRQGDSIRIQGCCDALTNTVMRSIGAR